MSATLPSLDEICEEFDELTEGPERLEYLVELGGTLAELPAEARVERNRVQGCQSNVWLVARLSGGLPPRLDFSADSDAPMVKGLVAILLAAFSGRTADEILAFEPTALFERLKLRTFLSPMRSNGLHSMVLHVRALAQGLQAAQAVGGATAETAKAAEPSASEASTGGGAARSTSLEPDEVARLRADFPILAIRTEDGRPLVYLDNAASTQRPRAVIESMVEAYESYYSNVHRGGHWLAARTTERYERARQAVQRLIHARQAQEIIFTAGTTAAINLVARSWGDAQVRRGDEIVLTEMEHHSNLIPWQQLAERTGAKLRFVPIAPDGELDLAAYRALLSPRTRLVAVTAVSNVLGVINPLEQIIPLAHERSAVVLVDAAQAIPHQTLDVQRLDIDFLAFSGHKMLGPSGIGALYGKTELLDAMPPFLGGGSMIRSASLDGFVPAALPAKFEAGTPPIVPAIGLGAAVEYLERIGLERIHAYEQALTRLAHQRLETIPGLRILGPGPERKGGTVTFVVDGLHADDIAKVLDTFGIAVRAGHHCAMPLHERLGVPASCRASFYFYNTPDEVAALADGVLEARRILQRNSGGAP